MYKTKIKFFEFRKIAVPFALLLLMSFLNVSMSFDLAKADEMASSTEITTGDAMSEVSAENIVNTNEVELVEPTPTPTPEPTPTSEPTPTLGVETLEASTSTPEVSLEVENTNDAEVSNEISSTASTGENIADGNSATSTIITGDANAAADVINIVNTNIIDSNGRMAILNAFSSLFGDLDLTSLENFQSCGECSGILNIGANNENNAEITNDIVVRAITGENSASGNGSGVIATGDANAAANVLNVVNTNVVGSNYLLLVFNNFGDWNGDVIFPSKYNFNLCCTLNVPAGISNSNSASVDNGVSVDAQTGENSADGESGGLIVSGNSNSAVNVLNQVNSNVLSSDSVYVAFRFFGDWSGNVYSAPEGFSWTQTDNGLILLGGGNSGGAGSNMEISNENNATIQNSVRVFALTGQNSVNGNANGGVIVTGDANAAANVVNVVNTNVLGRNWVLALVNIFGNWNGNIAFGRPDLWIGESASSIPREAKPGDIFTYKLTVINNGDTDATGITLVDDFNEHFLSVDNHNGGTLSEDGDKISWDLGDLKPGESRIISYDVRIGDNLPEGDTMISNTASIKAFEKDASQTDNVETTSIVLTRVSTYVPNIATNPQPDFKIVKTHNATSSTVHAGDSVDYKIVLSNDGSGQGYDAKIVDILYYATDTEPVTTREWNLDTVFGNEEIIVTYTLEILKNAKPGIYRNVAKFTAKDELVVDRYVVESESYIEVIENGEIEGATSQNSGGGIGDENLSSPADIENSESEIVLASVAGELSDDNTIQNANNAGDAGENEIITAETQKPADPIKEIPDNDKPGLNLAALAYLNSRFLLPIIFAAFLALIIAYYLRKSGDNPEA
ncbi:DUF11 domain-containing protein [Candidatus Giovannonibacteria bacterium]|nr:DUF11 domain-containing protein [Candidatus Giovannonibacteria bacterium]